MKKLYIQPSITVVRLQQQNIICTSDPRDYDSQSLSIPGGVINDESSVWTRESGVWEEEW